ncbi:tRNA pseudouridine(55) synthase TruB [Corynebacterium sp. 335C]
MNDLPSRPAAASGDPIADSAVIVVDKPAGMTSHDVVGRLRRVFGTRKVGHSGTLDPDATGVLVLGLNRGTRFLPHVHADAKSYSATIRLGASTLTDDAAGEVLSRAAAEDVVAVTDEAIRAGVADLTGDIMQVPAAVSAVKIDGVRAHERIRRGEHVEIPARPVTVSRFDVLGIRRVAGGAEGAGEAADVDAAPGGGTSAEAGPWIDVDVEVDCSAGTFIRSLARDLGAALGVGGHVTVLRRTAAGPFTVDDAIELDELLRLREEADAPLNPTALDRALGLDEACVRCFPVRDITAEEGAALSMGKWLEPAGLKGVHAARTPDGRVPALITESGKRAKTVFVVRPSTL